MSKGLRSTLAGLREKLYNVWDASEADTKIILVEPVLEALGWCTLEPQEVKRDYSLFKDKNENPNNKGQPDYVLFYKALPEVIIEVKRLGNVERAKSQIKKDYDTPSCIKVATDGEIWAIQEKDSKGWEQMKINDKNLSLLSHINKKAISERYDDRLEQARLYSKFEKEPDGDDQNQNDTNEALQILNEFVVRNKEQFLDEDAFSILLGAYVNTICIVRGTKKRLRQLLSNKLFIGLPETDRIQQLCATGRYRGIERSTPKIKSEEYIKDFLNLLSTLSRDISYNEASESLKRFLGKTTDIESSIKVAILSGILASLRPDDFMVYNKRSAGLLSDTIHKSLVNQNLETYLRFNNVYRTIAEKTGKSLVQLDIIASEIYEKEKHESSLTSNST